MLASSFNVKPVESPLSVEEAQSRLLQAVRLSSTETVALPQAYGRCLRESIVAAFDTPGEDNAAMDGYALQAADCTGASAELPVTLQVIGEASAGLPCPVEVPAGTCVRIMTGAAIPAGTDSVVQLELTDGGGSQVAIFSEVACGANVRRRGENFRKGRTLLQEGTILRSAEVGMLASADRAEVQVSCKPRVLVMATGGELREPGSMVTNNRVVNSNASSLSAMTVESGGIPTYYGIVPDERALMIEAVRRAAEFDFAISSGGVSVGAYDYVQQALLDAGAEILFWRVSMKPGKPILVARLESGTIFFGLPGNPVSSMVGFLLFVAPAIRRASGQRESIFPPVLKVPLHAPLRSGDGTRRSYLRVRVAVSADGVLVAHPMSEQGSAVSTSMLFANALAVVEPGAGTLSAGTVVSALLFGPIL